jgi:hypothetical protein
MIYWKDILLWFFFNNNEGLSTHFNIRNVIGTNLITTSIQLIQLFPYTTIFIYFLFWGKILPHVTRVFFSFSFVFSCALSQSHEAKSLRKTSSILTKLSHSLTKPISLHSGRSPSTTNHLLVGRRWLSLSHSESYFILWVILSFSSSTMSISFPISFILHNLLPIYKLLHS